MSSSAVLVFLLAILISTSAFRAPTSLLKYKSACKRNCCAEPPSYRSDNQYTFSKSFPFSINFPTQNRNQVQNFLSDTDYILGKIWEKSKARKVYDNVFSLQILTIPVPGFDVIMPEVQIEFESIGETVYIKSGDWLLKGMISDASSKLKDLISLVDVSGELHISPEVDYDAYHEPTSILRTRKVGGDLTIAEGYVTYSVTVNRPDFLRQSVLDATQSFIENTVSDFVAKRLPVKIVRAFKSYACREMKAEYGLM